MTATLQQALAGLNHQQRAAVTHEAGPLLILAGAGSGKTRVITVRIAWLIEEMGVDPRSILAVTFTNKAAGEMRSRAAALVDDATQVTIRTFHSFGAWLLRRNAEAVGLPREFSIYDDDDQVTLLRSIYPEQNRGALGRSAHLISRAKDWCLGPDDDLAEVTGDPEFDSVYREYERKLRAIGNVDFGDLILLPVRLLEQGGVVAERLRSRFEYILVDEYQDSNVAQFRLLSALAGPHTSVCVVGDDDQSIYRFRGAEVRNILSFPEIFPGTTVVRLEQNYRSTRPILAVADAVVANNQGRLGKTLFTTREGGEKPRLVLLSDHDAEVDHVLDLARNGDDRETAVLYRTNAQSRPFETALLRAGIPYRIIGTVRFYDREEIRDAVAFLKLLANGRDEVSFRRVVNKPTRGAGAKTLEVILARAADARLDLTTATDYALRDMKGKAARGLAEFVKVVEGLRARLDQGLTAAPSLEEGAPTTASPFDTTLATHLEASRVTLAAIVEDMLEQSGLRAHHLAQDEISGSQKIQNLEELANAASLYPATREGLVEFLEAIELDSARESGDDENARVVLITMHNTKGLEFDRVVITGLEDGVFPRNDDPEEVEEERRLFYVAVTRAREELVLTSCRMRRIHGRLVDLLPSRFIGEIPRELVEVDVEEYAGGGSGPAGSLGALRERRRTERAHPWPKGTAVYHDDYGSGVITRAWYSGSEPVVMVRFETGRSAQFLTSYTPLERIAGGGEEW